MGKLIIGFLAGFVLSDLISARFPQAQQFKIQPSGLLLSQTTGSTILQNQPQCNFPSITQLTGGGAQ